MNKPDKIEKKLFIITAVLLTIFGAIIGLYVAEFLGSYFADATKSQLTVSCIITSVIFAFVMLSLSKPLCGLFKKIMEKIQNYLSSCPPYKGMNLIFGLILGISIAILTSSVLSVFAPQLRGSVHFIIVTLSFCLVSYASAYIFNRILGNAHSPSKFERGYVIASSAFDDDRIVLLTPKLIGKIAIMDVTASKLTNALADAQIAGENIENLKRAFDNYNELKKLTEVKFAYGDVHKSETENIVELALKQHLKIIAKDRLELFDDDSLDVLYLSEI